MQGASKPTAQGVNNDEYKMPFITSSVTSLVPTQCHVVSPLCQCALSTKSLCRWSPGQLCFYRLGWSTDPLKISPWSPGSGSPKLESPLEGWPWPLVLAGDRPSALARGQTFWSEWNSRTPAFRSLATVLRTAACTPWPPQTTEGPQPAHSALSGLMVQSLNISLFHNLMLIISQWALIENRIE